MTANDWIELSKVWAPVVLAVVALLSAISSSLITWWLQRGNRHDIAQIKNGLKAQLLEKTAEAGFAKGKLEGEHAGLETGLSHIKIDDIDKLKK